METAITKLIELFTLICILNSCSGQSNNTINERWKPDPSFIETSIFIDYIEFKDSISKTLDDLKILTNFEIEYIAEDSILMLNKSDTFLFHFSLEKIDSISIAGLGFLKDTRTKNKENFIVETFNIPAKRLIEFNTRYHSTYYISARKDRKNEIKVKLNDIVTSIDQIPIFLNSSSHQKQPVKIILGIDKNIEYKDLNEIYRWCYLGSVNIVSLITKSDGFGHYEGINEKLIFWDENIEQSIKSYKLPPLPPRFTKEEFIESQERLVEVKNFDMSKINEFRNIIRDKKVTLIYSINSKISILEYLNLRIKMNEIIESELNRIALDKFENSYEELATKDRRLVREEIAKLIIERK